MPGKVSNFDSFISSYNDCINSINKFILDYNDLSAFDSFAVRGLVESYVVFSMEYVCVDTTVSLLFNFGLLSISDCSRYKQQIGSIRRSFDGYFKKCFPCVEG